LESPGLLGVEAWVRYHARRWAEQTGDDAAAIETARRSGTPVLTVRYEDLHANTEGWRRRMYEFLGVSPGEAAPLSVKTRTAPGFPTEDRTSFYRKGQVGDWKNFATTEFRRWFKEEAGEVLLAHGYERSRDW
jgi:hypothetical protein